MNSTALDCVYKSQKGQDAWVINEIFAGKRGGFFVDLAAADGVTDSNTHVLENDFGWNGVCIEPNPSFFRSLRQVRQCHVINSVVSNVLTTVPFRVDNGILGGIVSEVTDNSFRVRGHELESAEIIELPTTRLETILESVNAPNAIDYLSLDVEGSEEAIITSFDFAKYRFLCMTIERPTPLTNECLFAHGYIFVKNYSFDTFYVHESLADRVTCDPFEQVPPKDW